MDGITIVSRWEERALKVLRNLQAVITDSHVVYAAGGHGSGYVNKDAVFPYTTKMSALCGLIAKEFENDGVDVVAAPAIGGVILSQWVAFHLTKMRDPRKREVLSVYAEKEIASVPDPEGKGRSCFYETRQFIFKRGYDKLIVGQRVLVLEDVLTTGGSVHKVVEAVRAAGAKEVIGVGVLCNRGGVTPADIGGVPKLVTLTNIKMDVWNEKDCPLCLSGVPINTDVGHGRQFLARKQT